ncbi:hypothetical protein B0O99DRAFT_624062 [Bisporella sp. PMI_857]|nr:hypothetical protein B0O99DRAFT_624062 [Bisporella sp. PMI_857]
MFCTQCIYLFLTDAVTSASPSIPTQLTPTLHSFRRQSNARIGSRLLTDPKVRAVSFSLLRSQPPRSSPSPIPL